jgi:hypothetical protein
MEQYMNNAAKAAVLIFSLLASPAGVLAACMGYSGPGGVLS